MGPARTPWQFRFWTKVQPMDSGCWEWQAFRDKDGYGLFGPKHGQALRAHRFAYDQFVAPVPRDFLVLHTCDNPACVRPEHLRVGTTADNVADKMRKGRWVGNGLGEQTHCKRGHPFSGDNLGYQQGGKYRCCLTCKKVYERRKWTKSNKKRALAKTIRGKIPQLGAKPVEPQHS